MKVTVEHIGVKFQVELDDTVRLLKLVTSIINSIGEDGESDAEKARSNTGLPTGVWLQHDGGDCPVPLETPVKLRFRIGSEHTAHLPAESWCWKHTNENSDITEYMIVE
jgi:hypothetical protein